MVAIQNGEYPQKRRRRKRRPRRRRRRSEDVDTEWEDTGGRRLSINRGERHRAESS